MATNIERPPSSEPVEIGGETGTIPASAIDQETGTIPASGLDQDIYALLEIGVPLQKIEELYGTDEARRAAQSFVVRKSNSSSLRVGAEILQRSVSEQRRALANPDFVSSLLGSLAEDPGEALMDPLMMTPIKDPVVLSTGFVLDRSTALDDRGRLRFALCPFSRTEVRLEVYPLQMLRQRAIEWRLKQLTTCLQLAEIFVEAAHWESAEKIFRTAESFLDDVGDGTYLNVARCLAMLERRAPNMSPARAVRSYRRLHVVASAGERMRLIKEAAEEGLREATSLLNAAAVAANEDATNIASINDAKAWLAMHSWLAEPENVASWEDLRVPWGEQLLRAAKAGGGSDAEVQRWIRHLWRLYDPEGRAAFLVREGLAADDAVFDTCPDFDPTGWQTNVLDRTIPWLMAEQGRIRVNDGDLHIEYGSDMSPEAGSDWMLEVAFKPDSLRHDSYMNSIFSQHGHGTGWELRTGRDAVEFVFTTDGGGSNGSHNAFFVRPPTGVRCGMWTHCLVLYEHAISTLSVYVDGAGPTIQRVRGAFVVESRMPRLGQNPCWEDRSFVGEVAFARTERTLPCFHSDLSTFAAELAGQRFAALEETPESLEVMVSSPFLGSPRWNVRWLNGQTSDIVLDRRGCWELFGHHYQLQRTTTTVFFTWDDGTVQTLQSVEGDIITWVTSNASSPTISWARRMQEVQEATWHADSDDSDDDY